MPPQRTQVSSGSPYEAAFGFSRAVRVGDRVLVAGTAPIWPDGSCPDDVAAQADRVFAIITQALAEAGATPADVVRTRVYLVDAADAETVGTRHRAAFGEGAPASTMVVIGGLVDPRWRLEAEAEAVIS